MPQDHANDILNQNIADATRTFTALSEHGPALSHAVEVLTQCLLGGHKLLACGNGGSSADASHIVAEIVGRFVKERPGYPAIALSDPTGILTAVANDYGFDNVFARQVQALGQPGDVLLVISTSGNSGNILRALDEADKIGIQTIALLGKDGGKARGRAMIEIIVQESVTARVQEAHQLLYHSLCEGLDRLLCR